MQSGIHDMISKCVAAQKLPPKSFASLNRSVHVQEIKNANFNFTRDTLQKMSYLNCKDLRRNYDWKVLERSDQKIFQEQSVHEYKYSITDPNRTAALFERTQSIFKLLMDYQLNRKINYDKDSVKIKVL